MAAGLKQGITMTAMAGAAALAATLPVPAMAQSEPLIGQLMAVGFNFCPRGWAPAEGQLLPISQNSALFSLLGTTYGGDGRTTFALPDLRGRAAIGEGRGPGLGNLSHGQRGGTETVTTGPADRSGLKPTRDPYLAVRWCIALQGVYPSRS